MKKNILIIGGGSIGERHVVCFLATGRAEVSLCEISEEVRNRVASAHNLAASFASLDEAIASKPDAAVICAPAHVHMSIASQLVAAGIAVLIEKPLSTSVDDAATFTAQVESSGLESGVAFVYRANPVLQDMHRAIVEGNEFGKILQISVVAGQHFPFYRPAYREIYFTKHETGGGLIQDMFPHLLNAVEWFAGPMSRVIADADHLALEGIEVEDSLTVIGRHGDAMASYSMNLHQAANETTILIVCEKGTAKFEYTKSHWLATMSPEDEFSVQVKIEMERNDLFTNQANAFLDQLESGTEALCSVAEALTTLKTTLAVLQSSRNGGERIDLS